MIQTVDTKGHQSRLDSFFGKPVVVKRKDPTPTDSKGKQSKTSKKK